MPCAKAWEAARDSRPFDLCLIDTQNNRNHRKLPLDAVKVPSSSER